MLASAKQNGRVGLIVDNGCLFRGGAEKAVRSKVIDKDLIECVISARASMLFQRSYKLRLAVSL